MTVEGPDGGRYLADRDGRPIDNDYDGPAIEVVEGKRTLIRSQLDPASGTIIDALTRRQRPSDHRP